MNIADNPISKPYLGGIIVAMIFYLEIRISDTLGWPQGMLYKLDLKYSRGCCTHVHWVDLQLRSQNIFQSQRSGYDIPLMFSVKLVKDQEYFSDIIHKSLIDAMLQKKFWLRL